MANVKTTTETLTDSQIRALRHEAIGAHDYAMVAICDYALAGEIDMDDYTTVDRRDDLRIRKMGHEDAIAEVVRAINNAEAQG